MLITLRGLKDILQEHAFLGFSSRALLRLSLPSNSGLVNLKLLVTSLFNSLPGYSHVHDTIPEPRRHGDLLSCVDILVMVLMTRGLAGFSYSSSM